MLAGCTSDTSGTRVSPGASPTPSPSTAQQEVIVALLDADDDQPTMSDEQRSALMTILVTGEVTFEQYRGAVINTLECAEDAGLMIDGPRTVQSGGQPTLTWGWRDPASTTGDVSLGEYCRQVHSFGIEQAYLNSGVAVEDERRQLETWRADIVTCYADAGVPLEEPDTDIFELLNTVDALAGTHAAAVHDCIAALDITVD